MSQLAGTLTLARFIVRRDRVRIVVWIASIVALMLVTALSVKGLYPTQASLDEAVTAFGNNAAAIALNGPAQGLDTLGGEVAFQVGATGLVVVALMSLLMTGRLTRFEEETGRLELLRSMAVGRHAPATAALIVVASMNVVLAALLTVGLAGMSLPLAGPLVLGVSYAALGLVFAAAAMVAAQITENTRVVYGSCGAVLGAAFALRAAGDVGDGTLSWFSPIGWAQKARPFAGERWWPLLIAPAAAGVLVVLATVLADRRDLGAGLVASRGGPADGPRTLSGPIGLAVRLQRGTVIGWSTGLFVTGVAYGWVADDIKDLVGDNKAMQEMIARAGGVSLTDSYLSTSLLLLALVGGGFAIASALRLRSEETALRAEPILATPVSRVRWAASHLAVALGGSVIVLAAGGLGIGVAYGIVSSDPAQVPRLLGAALVQLPAVWLLVGLAAALFGLLPRAVGVAWAALAACLVVGLFGELLDLPGWLSGVSPFEHLPRPPAADVSVVSLAVVTAAAACLVSAGLGGFRRRDVG